jgi:hypothetical protein
VQQREPELAGACAQCARGERAKLGAPRLADRELGDVLERAAQVAVGERRPVFVDRAPDQAPAHVAQARVLEIAGEQRLLGQAAGLLEHVGHFLPRARLELGRLAHRSQPAGDFAERARHVRDRQQRDDLPRRVRAVHRVAVAAQAGEQVDHGGFLGPI